MIDLGRFNSIFELNDYFSTEDKCRKAIFESRWDKKDVICPFCRKHHCYTRKDGSFRCPHCVKHFSVLVGTIFENTRISLRKRFIAMYLGGRETNRHETKKTKGTQGGAKTKTLVFGMTMRWQAEDVDTMTGEVKEKTHTYEVAKKVSDTTASMIISIIRHF